MSHRFEMIRVDPTDIALDEPLPYSVLTPDGSSLLAMSGSRITDPHQLINLIQNGWRKVRRVRPSSDEPRARAVQSTVPEHLTRVQPASLGQTTALVADDMQMARTMLTQILISAGVARVIAVEDGQRALSRFSAEAPNLVLLDIDMPKLDGLSALKQIKSWSPGVFACLISANSSLVNVQMAREYAVDGFLVKPYTPLNLKRVLARYQARLPKSPKT
jgi:CheY-like chemotaxis protein